MTMARRQVGLHPMTIAQRQVEYASNNNGLAAGRLAKIFIDPGTYQMWLVLYYRGPSLLQDRT